MVTWPTGQFVTVGAQDVMVTIFVEYTVDNVDVVISLLTLYVLGIVCEEDWTAEVEYTWNEALILAVDEDADAEPTMLEDKLE